MTGYVKFFIISALILLCYCSKQEDESAQQANELMFVVDSTKLELSTHLADLGIVFNSPKNWEPIADDLFKELSSKTSIANFTDSVFSCKPISIFLNPDNNSMLFITSVQGISDTSSFVKYKNLLHEKLSPRKTGDFLKDQVTFSQFLIQNDQYINFKLLFQNSRHQFIQFDYIIPTNSYVSELKAIEASIGSIKLINE